jgi:hypothetical protein
MRLSTNSRFEQATELVKLNFGTLSSRIDEQSEQIRALSGQVNVQSDQLTLILKETRELKRT